MAQYPIKMLRDEQGNPFVPLVSPEAVKDVLNRDWESMIKDKMDQLDPMPAPSEDLLNKIVQYKGTTTENYTQGCFYKCVSNGAAVPTYSWELVNVQDLSNYLAKDNSSIYNPINDYNPATKKYVDDVVSNIDTLKREIVQTLPVTNIKEDTIYMVPKATAGTNNSYDEYMYINNAWEKIGDTEVDLSNYLSKTNTTAYTPSGSYNPATKKYVDDSVSGIDLSNYLAKNNTTSYTPSGSYNPATKKYIDDLAGTLIGYVDTTSVPSMSYTTELGDMVWNSSAHTMSLVPTSAGWAEGRGILTFNQEVYGLRLSFTLGTATYASLFIKDNNDENTVYLDGSYSSSDGDVELFIPHLDSGAELLFQIGGTGQANQTLGYYTIEGMRTLQNLSTIKEYVDIAKRDAEEEVKQECPTQITYIDNNFNEWSYSTTSKLAYVKTGTIVQLFGEFKKIAGSSAAAFTSVPKGWAPGRTVTYYPFDYDFSTGSTTYLNPVSVSTDGSIWITNDGYGNSRLDGFTYVISPYSGNSGGGVACYTEDTIIYGKKDKKISDLKVGDEIYSYDHNNDEKVLTPITNIATHKNIEKLIKIVAGGEEFRCTPEHRIFTTEKPYCEAREIKAGFHIFNADQKLIEVESVEMIKDSVTGYDIDTQYHNYFITKNKLLTKTEPVTEILEK